MSILTEIMNLHGRNKHDSFEPPDNCPICHHGIEPKFLIAIWSQEHQRLDAAFQCPRKSCQEMFIAEYRSPYDTSSNWQLNSLAPTTVVYPKFPEAVSKVSSRFVEIMNQVTVADAKGLNQLVGMGLRKALEFLLKDFTIKEHPDQKAAIKKGELAWVIGQYVTDPNINTCAKRAAWLGNDETHYLRKWEDKDITDLKKLVQLTVNWIESHELTRGYRTEMPEPERKK